MNNHQNSSRKIILLYLIILFFASAPVLSQENYVFERMWPTLQQPWFLHEIRSMAMDQKGNILTVDYLNNRVEKYTSNGQLITQWGKYGFGEGDLMNPTGIAVDDNGYVHVVAANGWKKFSPDGDFLLKYELDDDPVDIAINKEVEILMITRHYESGSNTCKVC